MHVAELQKTPQFNTYVLDRFTQAALITVFTAQLGTQAAPQLFCVTVLTDDGPVRPKSRCVVILL